MENFRTQIKIDPAISTISYQNSIMFLGSCFTENIGNKLADLKMTADVNPFGIVYNPASIKKSIEILLEKKQFVQNDIFFDNEQWNSFYHHSRFSNSSSEQCLKEVNDRIQISSEFIEKTDFLFLTFGTAWVYKHNRNSEIVSNCHKIPAKEFTRLLLNSEDIVRDYEILINRLLAINKNLKIIFTVSPVRHWKDGAVENQLSKSILMVAIHRIIEKFSCAAYFPAYEIMMDDLRDYRFYAEDMLHLNSTAINYIWNKFSGAYFDEPTIQLQKEIEKIRKAMNHRPFNENSESYRNFLKANLNQIHALEKKHPFLNLAEEKLFFEK